MASPALKIFIPDTENAQPAILLSSYGTGANEGKNLGVPGYSHDIVMQLYVPLLEEWGKVIHVVGPEENLEAAINEARQAGLAPIHLSVIPCQDAYLSPNVPNVLMPAWEFPDIPDDSLNQDECNDWAKVANNCAALLVSGPFTEKAFRSSGTTTPIHFVQVPTPNPYFQLPQWKPERQHTIDCSGFSFPREKDEPTILPFPVRPRKPAKGLKRIGKRLETVVRKTARKAFSKSFYSRFSMIAKRINGRAETLPEKDFDKLELSGVVYTSIFNPNDGRKNWTDLLTSFLMAIGDKEDATLVIKLVTRNSFAVAKFLNYYLKRDIPHQCRLVVIPDYLTEQQLVELADASTYYIQTTRAEGNCLPLMNYLAAGRPGISPCHSAISDYFDEEIGFVAQSHQEPAAWPHDPQLRIRSTWARLVWPSMVSQIRESYRVAKSEPQTYNAMSRAAQTRLSSWASSTSVQERLIAALEQVRQQSGTDQSKMSNFSLNVDATNTSKSVGAAASVGKAA